MNTYRYITNKAYRLIALFSLFVMYPTGAQAQTIVVGDMLEANQSTVEAYGQRSPSWWHNLGEQLTSLVAVKNEQVKEVALKNIIYFANQYGDKVDLRSTVPYLLSAYANNPRLEIRFMALAALGALGSDDGMERLGRLVRREKPGRLRDLTLIALNDYYRLK